MKTKEIYITKLIKLNMLQQEHYQLFDIYTFYKGEHILHQGQRLDILYILVDGKNQILSYDI